MAVHLAGFIVSQVKIGYSANAIGMLCLKYISYNKLIFLWNFQKCLSHFLKND